MSLCWTAFERVHNDISHLLSRYTICRCTHQLQFSRDFSQALYEAQAKAIFVSRPIFLTPIEELVARQGLRVRRLNWHNKCAEKH